MWEHLDDDEVRRRTDVLEALQLRQVLSVLAFRRGDPKAAAQLLVEHLGRELSPLEDPRTKQDVLEREWTSQRSDAQNQRSAAWNAEISSIATNVALPPIVAEEIVRFNAPGNPTGYHYDSGCAEVAGNPSLPPHLAPRLATYTAAFFYGDDGDEDGIENPDRVVTSLSYNFGLPIEIYADIDASKGLRMDGWNISMPIAWMEFLIAQASRPDLRQALASNIMLPEWMFEQLAEASDYVILGELARNPSAGPQVLSVLSQSGSEYVVAKVATHRNTPSEALSRIADSSISSVRAYAAGNPNMALEDLVALSRDDGCAVWVAGNPSTPQAILEKLSCSGAAGVRANVARNPSAATEVLQRLARDPDERVRRALARAPITDQSILLRLAMDDDRETRSAAYGNPMATEDVRAAAAIRGIMPIDSSKGRRCTWAVDWAESGPYV